MRVKSVLRKLLGSVCLRPVVVVGWDLVEGQAEAGTASMVWVRTKVSARGRCGKCGVVSPWFDNGGGERRWRHVDVGFATCELVAAAPGSGAPSTA